MIKKIFIIFVFVVYTWCCEDGYLNIDGNCYFNGDIKFLKDHGLEYDYIYSRAFGDTSPDDLLKKRMILKLRVDMKKSLNWIRHNSYMFDDNNSVRKCLTQFGVRCYNPTNYNEAQKNA